MAVIRAAGRPNANINLIAAIWGWGPRAIGVLSVGLEICGLMRRDNLGFNIMIELYSWGVVVVGGKIGGYFGGMLGDVGVVMGGILGGIVGAGITTMCQSNDDIISGGANWGRKKRSQKW